MRFRPHQKVIDLLVGQQLYTSADAAIRELLQNAEDACALQQIAESSYTPAIVVRYSPSANYVEVVDNGLGMDQEVVEHSFASVGAPKDEIPHLRELLAKAKDSRVRQIAQFGIGVLSCFGVADSITLKSKMEGKPGVSYLIRDYHEDFEGLSDIPTERGTTVRLQLKSGGQMKVQEVVPAVKKYARHAEHVEMENVDSKEREAITESWHGAELSGAIRVEDSALRGGYLALSPAWDTPGNALQSRLVVCNGGFLVAERESSLLHQQAIGYEGEIDVEPGELTILLNREGFK